MRLLDEVVIPSCDPGHQPRIVVMARGRGHEIVRTSAYYSSHEDRLGRYRRRRPAGVRWKRPSDATYAEALVLWTGSYAAGKLESCPHLPQIAAAFGLEPALLVEALARGRTLEFQ